MAQSVSGTTIRHRPTLEVLEDRLVPSAVVGWYPDGVWRYDTTAGWAHISTEKSTLMYVDGAGDVFGRFSDGLWRWDAATTNWQKLTDELPGEFQVTTGGVVYGSFPNGTWRWSFDGWQQISPFQYISSAVSNSDAFFGSYSDGTPGTWRWTPTTSWSLLSQAVGQALQADDAGDLVAGFGYGAGSHTSTWRWSPGSGWLFLPPAPAQVFPFSVSANGTIFQDRGAGGIWRASPGATSFTQISTSNTHTHSQLYALPDGNLLLGLDNGPGANPQINGWYWNASSGWHLLPINSVFVGFAIDKVGDVFYGPGDLGTWMWSPSGGAQQIGPASPAILFSQT
jgi:hypothetical protein